MSEYLTYTLWRQREERMPHELEHQRVVQERLSEQVQEQRLQEEHVLDVSPEAEFGEALEPTEAVSELEHDLVTR